MGPFVFMAGAADDALQLQQHAIKVCARVTRVAGDAPEVTIDRAGDQS